MPLGLVCYGSSSDEESEDEIQASITPAKKSLSLPNPKSEYEESEENGNIQQIKIILPTPKTNTSKINIVEENDEYLNKKAICSEKPPAKVKITIPSLAEYKGVESNITKSSRAESKSIRPGGLLSLLPKPKSETFVSNTAKTDDKPLITKSNTFLIPESVKKKNASSKPSNASLKAVKKVKLVSVSDSDDSGEESDFFSLQKEVVLPNVNINEINEMVSKKAAQMANAFTKVEVSESMKESIDPIAETEISQFDIDKHEAVKVLSGYKEAKRRKIEDIQFVELSDEQIMPNKNEWYRTALASSTGYQRRGMVDEEDQPGTRRKNQITYLANQALANDSELQAIWSENRANRRATQNKYGF